jgi:hypothetical protein
VWLRDYGERVVAIGPQVAICRDLNGTGYSTWADDGQTLVRRDNGCRIGRP